MTKLVALFNRYRSVIAYLFWGVVTTVVNIVVFQFLSSGVHWNYQLANVIAWFLSVLVAYFTNKVWVFGSHYSTVKAFLKEFFWFYFYRGLTLIMDVIIMYVGISLLKFDSPLQQLIVKIIDNVIVVIANYIFSKWLIFHDNRDIVEHGKDED
ncbi:MULTISPECIES: GtrA family protein [Limosilactobacillus]|uniref:GtrA family protein n=1 Tax=Limosilactobacillus TaxID=2742598 RepID=UPI001D9963DF|nr:GtrA family protein [Limosilactobacillus pontis]HJE26568.1 GtrA family protein [Limosilactobacillus pontis]